MSRKGLIFWLVFLPTIGLFYGSLYLALLLRYHGVVPPGIWLAHLRPFSLIFLFWLGVLFIHGLFEVQALRRYTSLLFNLISAMAVNFLVAVFYFYAQPSLILTPRRTLVILVSVSFVLLLAWYLIIKYAFKNRLTEGVYLFSFNNELRELEQAVAEHSYLGYRVLGHLNQQTLPAAGFDKNVGIILPDNLQSSPEVAERFYQLRTHGVKFYNHKDFYEQLLRRVYLSQLNEVWFLENINYREKRFYNIIKRLTDVLVALIAGLVFVVTWPVAALLIKLTSRGSIFFVQERVGKDGQIFKVYKYRTMNSWSATNTWTSVNDPRITRVGKFMRKSRLDELPQFINLLFGNMSLVGPRPEQPHIVEELKKQIPFYDERHLVKPGLTGWAQINNIYAASLEETKLKLQYDLYYIKHRGFLFDLEIILKSIYYIFTWRGR
ncbi:MAG: sugar transferase [Patescibacteria group bacterium]|nr:sugar transferase [Patescibacteria group bacterium]